ncbi:hypothetical protein CPB86DRAFT_821520 [Serendipita vermifera]|nr:hypothetical protein CPB86DRAFT_821520 [Serendipita vermifera]
MSKFLQLHSTSTRERKVVQAINEDLAQIKRALSNENLAELFEGRAIYFCRGKRLNNRERLDKVAKIVKGTRDEVLQLESIDLRTSTNLDRHEKEIPILKDGCITLNQLKKRPTPSDELDDRIEGAMAGDRAAFDKRVKRINELLRPNPQTIRIRFMDEPSRNEEVISRPTHLRLSYHNRRVWCSGKKMYIRQAIEKDRGSIELDVVKIGNKHAYIVAVLQDMNDQTPIPLEIARGGGSCCNTKCRNLREHLKQLWPSHVVTQAIRLSEPEQNPLEVWSCTLSDDFFDPLTNDLYLRRKPIK